MPFEGVMTGEIIGELSGEEIERVEALARARGLTCDSMIAELLHKGLPAEEARASRVVEESSGNWNAT